MNNRLKRLEAIERQLRRQRQDTDALRLLAVEGLAGLAAELLDSLGDCSAVGLCGGILARTPGESLDTFRGRIMDTIRNEHEREPLPLMGLQSLYRLLPSAVKE